MSVVIFLISVPLMQRVGTQKEIIRVRARMATKEMVIIIALVCNKNICIL